MPMCKCDNIKVYIREMRCQPVDWIEPAKDRAQGRAFVNNCNEPSGSKEKKLSICSVVKLSAFQERLELVINNLSEEPIA